MYTAPPAAPSALRSGSQIITTFVAVAAIAVIMGKDSLRSLVYLVRFGRFQTRDDSDLFLALVLMPLLLLVVTGLRWRYPFGPTSRALSARGILSLLFWLGLIPVMYIAWVMLFLDLGW